MTAPASELPQAATLGQAMASVGPQDYVSRAETTEVWNLKAAQLYEALLRPVQDREHVWEPLSRRNSDWRNEQRNGEMAGKPPPREGAISGDHVHLKRGHSEQSPKATNDGSSLQGRLFPLRYWAR